MSQSKMNKPEKLVTQYVLDTTIRKKTQITKIGHEILLQTTGGKDKPNIVLIYTSETNF